MKTPRIAGTEQQGTLASQRQQRRPVLALGILLVLSAVLLANGATDVTRELRARPRRRLHVEAELAQWCRTLLSSVPEPGQQRWRVRANRDRIRFLQSWSLPDRSPPAD